MLDGACDADDAASDNNATTGFATILSHVDVMGSKKSVSASDVNKACGEEGYMWGAFFSFVGSSILMFVQMHSMISVKTAFEQLAAEAHTSNSVSPSYD